MKQTNLFLGDCLEEMKNIESGSVDLILADPPYGTTKCKWDAIIPVDEMWHELKRIKKPNAAIVLTSSQPFTSILVTSNLKMFKHEWIWEKNRGSNFANTVREPMKEHEIVLVFADKKWTYNRQMEPRKGSGGDRAKYKVDYLTDTENYNKFEGKTDNTLTELRVPSSVQKFNTVAGKEKTKHATQKPVPLMEYLIKTYSNEEDVVLDFCMGSGSTGVAAINLNRYFIGIEKDYESYELAESRIRNAIEEVETSTSRC